VADLLNLVVLFANLEFAFVALSDLVDGVGHIVRFVFEVHASSTDRTVIHGLFERLPALQLFHR